MKLDSQVPGMLPLQPQTSEHMERLERAARNADSSKDGLDKVAQEFEALMLSRMVESMRTTVPESGLFPRGSGQQLYDHMMDQALADHLSKSGGLGIAKMLEARWNPGTEATTEPRRVPVGDRVGRPERNDEAERRTVSPTELDRILRHSSRDLGGTDDGARPLSDILPPESDPWLQRPDAEAILRAIISAEPDAPKDEPK